MPEIQSDKEKAQPYADKLKHAYNNPFNIGESLNGSGEFAVNTEFSQSSQAASRAFLGIASLLYGDGKKIEDIAYYLEQKDEESALGLLSTPSD